MEEALVPQSSGEWNAEYRICRPDGETRFLHANGRTLFHEDHGTRQAIYRIVTAVDRTEQRQAQAALLEAGQLAAVGRLAAAVSHEINNPLEAAINLLYLLRFEIPGRTGREYLGQAESELARVSQIATNTLRLYKGQRATVPFELKSLTQSVLQLFQERMAMRGIALDYRLEDGIFISSSEGEIQQVLVNLVGNAIDAMPNGGRLRVRCRAFRSKIGHREPGVGICIADTGTGMSRETLQRVFEPFFTTKGDAGTGIGLWLSSEILHKHGFKLSVKSKLGRGTVMSMYLPDKVALIG